MFRILLTVIQVFSAFAIVGLVLLQRGKGADAGAGFGAGASGTVFGARGASTALSRATAVFAAVFMINSLLLAYLGSKGSTEQPKSILDEAAAVQRQAPSRAPGSNAPIRLTPTAPATSAPAPTTSGTPGGAGTTAAPSAPAPGAATSTQPASQAPPAPAPAPAAPAAPTK